MVNPAMPYSGNTGKHYTPFDHFAMTGSIGNSSLLRHAIFIRFCTDQGITGTHYEPLVTLPCLICLRTAPSVKPPAGTRTRDGSIPASSSHIHVQWRGKQVIMMSPLVSLLCLKLVGKVLPPRNERLEGGHVCRVSSLFPY
jgi:hypothetical protein